ncbi:MAG: STAS domain-containing protein [Terracidiphilus sp.]
MTLQVRAVTLKHLPEEMSEQVERAFLTEMRNAPHGDRPRIVMNCSSLRGMSSPVIHFLLCCLEEAMKRNGDVRLSAVPKTLTASLQTLGLDRLFKMFDSDVDAIKSFQRGAVSVPPLVRNATASPVAAENAA